MEEGSMSADVPSKAQDEEKVSEKQQQCFMYN